MFFIIAPDNKLADSLVKAQKLSSDSVITKSVHFYFALFADVIWNVFRWINSLNNLTQKKIVTVKHSFVIFYGKIGLINVYNWILRMIVFLSVEIISHSHNHSIATAWPNACRCRNLTILIVKFCGYNTGLYVLLRQNNIFFHRNMFWNFYGVRNRFINCSQNRQLFAT